MKRDKKWIPKTLTKDKKAFTIKVWEIHSVHSTPIIIYNSFYQK